MSKRFTRNKSRLLAATLVPSTLFMNLGTLTPTPLYAEEDASGVETPAPEPAPVPSEQPSVSVEPEPKPVPEPDPIPVPDTDPVPGSEDSSQIEPGETPEPGSSQGSSADSSVSSEEPGSSASSSDPSSGQSSDSSSGNSEGASSSETPSSGTSSDGSNGTTEGSTSDSKDPSSPDSKSETTTENPSENPSGDSSKKDDENPNAVIKLSMTRAGGDPADISRQGGNYFAQFTGTSVPINGSSYELSVKFTAEGAKDGDEVTVTGNGARKTAPNTYALPAGDYTVSLKGKKVSVKVLKPELKHCSASAVNLTYNGSAQSPVQISNQDNASYTVTINDEVRDTVTDAGTYSYKVVFTKTGFKDLEVGGTFTVAKKKVAVQYDLQAADGVVQWLTKDHAVLLVSPGAQTAAVTVKGSDPNCPLALSETKGGNADIQALKAAIPLNQIAEGTRNYFFSTAEDIKNDQSKNFEIDGLKDLTVDVLRVQKIETTANFPASVKGFTVDTGILKPDQFVCAPGIYSAAIKEANGNDLSSIYNVSITDAGVTASVKEGALPLLIQKLQANPSFGYSIVLTPKVGDKSFPDFTTTVSGTISMSEETVCVADPVIPAADGWIKGNSKDPANSKKLSVTPKAGYELFNADGQTTGEILFTDEGRGIQKTVIAKAPSADGTDATLHYQKLTFNADYVPPKVSGFTVTNVDGTELTSAGGSLFTGKSALNVVLNASDETSGIAKIEYCHSSTKVPSSWTEAAAVSSQDDSGGENWTFTANCEGKLGYLYVRVTDTAGNYSITSFELGSEDPQAIIVDIVKPYGWIGHEIKSGVKWNTAVDLDGQTKTFSDQAVTFVAAIDEEYFDYADSPVFSVTKDGEPMTAAATSWSVEKGLHTSRITVSDTGEYRASLSFTDLVGNDMVQGANDGSFDGGSISHDSGKATITTGIVVAGVQNAAKDIILTSRDNQLNLTIKGQYFLPESTDLSLVSVVDINDRNLGGKDKQDFINAVNARLHNRSSWKNEGEVNKIRTFSIVLSEAEKSGLAAPDGRYVFNVKSADLTTNTRDNSVRHLVDFTGPKIESIELSDSYDFIGAWQPHGETMAMRHSSMVNYYNDQKNVPCTVTVTASDQVAGIGVSDGYAGLGNSGRIILKLNTQDNAYTSGYLTNTVSSITQDLKDRSRFTTTFTIPKESAQQLKNTVKAAAVDNRENTGEWKSDNRLIINDTIRPNVTVSYDKSAYLTHTDSQTITDGVANQYYKDTNCTVSVTISDENVFREDVGIKVIRNGIAKELSPSAISWVSLGNDVWQADLNPVRLFNGEGVDGEYQFEIHYHDRSMNEMNVSSATGRTSGSSYFTPLLIVDTTAPKLTVDYTSYRGAVNVMPDVRGISREYYDNQRTGIVTLVDQNVVFRNGAIGQDLETTLIEEDVSGVRLGSSTAKPEAWKAAGNQTYTQTIVYPGDSNYTFGMKFTDLAGNTAVWDNDYFTVDTTAPTDLQISYSRSVLDTMIQGISFGFYQAPVTATVTATDNISGIHGFNYSYLKAQGVSSVNASLANQPISDGQIIKSSNLKSGTATFTIPAGMLTSNSQFNGTVDFDSTNRSKLTSRRYADTRRLVVDNIAPTCNVQFPAPDNSDGSLKYYASDPTVTVTINEANFDAADVKISMTCDGGAYPVSLSWGSAGDTHTGTFTFTAEGRYSGTISYTDKSGNSMATYTFEEFVLDKTKPEIAVDVNSNTNKDIPAFREMDLTPHIEVRDDYLDESSVQGEYTKYVWDEKTVVSTSPELDKASASGTQYTYSLSKIGTTRGDDGIYSLKGSARDKAGNTNEADMTFIVNRYGSVYLVGKSLADILNQYNQSVDDDLIVYEFNAVTDQEQAKQKHVTKVSLTRDGVDVELGKNLKTAASSHIDDEKVDHIDNRSRSNWNGYSYSILPDAFVLEQEVADREGLDTETSADQDDDPVILDGVYRIALESTDGSGVNSSYSAYADELHKAAEESVSNEPVAVNAVVNEDEPTEATPLGKEDEQLKNPIKGKYLPPKILEFRVDSTAPVISRVQGLEESVYNEAEHLITLSINDVIALDSIEVYVDDVLQEDCSYTDLSKNENTTLKELQIVLKEKNTPQKVRIVAKDRAGNFVDTDELVSIQSQESLRPYFEKTILVSTSPLVRWYNNKPLFFSTIAAFIALVAGGIYAFYAKKFKDSDEEEEK